MNWNSGNYRWRFAVTAIPVLLSMASVMLVAQTPALPPSPTAVGEAYLAINVLPAAHGIRLKVASSGFASDGDIPFEYSGYRANLFPGLSWSKGPRRTRSYVAVLQDADGLNGDDAVLHWTMYDIPVGVTSLARGMRSPPAGAQAGPNRNGAAQGYLGPRTGPGRKHRYPFQVFALDTIIPPDPSLDWVALKAAMSGHVLASGEIIGLGQLDPLATPAPPPAP